MDEREWVSVREGGVDERVCEEFLTCPVEINDFRIYYTVQSSVEPVERKEEELDYIENDPTS